MFDKTEIEVLNKLNSWGDINDNVRALILTSSRVGPNPKPDKLSDYDIEVIVDDLVPFNNDEWLSTFGTILVKWPLYPKNTGYNKNSITRLVVFTDFPRIDFQIIKKTNRNSFSYDNGYKILLDKDGISNKINPPTFSEYVIKKPNAEEFYETVNGFYWDLPYIAKSIKRGELAFAKYMLLSAIRYDSFEKMLSWYVGLKNNWSVNYGVHGRNLEKLADKTFANEINSLVAGNNPEDVWQSALKMEQIFNKMYLDLAKYLSYNKKVVKISAVLDYCNKIKEV
jgi:aminoglycoside 6-adenylyltransferase